MLSNFWKGLTFYCINGHEHPIEMIYKEGGTLFFACPKYMLVDDNRLSYPDAEKIVSMMADAVQNSLAGDDFCDFTGYRFKLRQISVEVLRYSDGDIRLGILNRGPVS